MAGLAGTLLQVTAIRQHRLLEKVKLCCPTMRDTRWPRNIWKLYIGQSHQPRLSVIFVLTIMNQRLWEESWEDGAQVFSADPKMAYDPTKIHRIEHKGKYFSMAGAQQTHPSPQRTPVLFQAGSSIAGNAFGAKHSEVIFTGQPTLEKMKAYSAAIRAQAKEYGRDPSSLKIIQSILPIIGKTEEEAKAKFEYYKTQLSIEGGLARFGGFTGIDLSGYALDEPFKFEGTLKDNATHSAIKHYKDYAEDQELTPRLVGEINAFGGLGPRPCGSAEQVADFFEKWFIEADIDGFNISCKHSISSS